MRGYGRWDITGSGGLLVVLVVVVVVVVFTAVQIKYIEVGRQRLFGNCTIHE